MNFKIKFNKNSKIPVIKLNGDVTADNIHILSKKLDGLAGSEYSKVAVDVSEINYIDSHGLGVFVFSWNMMKQNNKELIFLNPQGFIKDMLEGTNLYKVLTIVYGEENL